MSILNLPLDEKMNLAYSSNDHEVLYALSRDVSSKVRRLLAKNRNITNNILQSLAFDPVMNVSYMAIANPNCSFSREFEADLHPCVLCTKDERNMNCHTCNEINL